MRGRLEGLGPITAAQIAELAGRDSEAQINGALIALEAEGFAMRGRFSRRVLAQSAVVRAPVAGANSSLHRETAARGNRAGHGAGFSAFLGEWQRVLPGARMQGSDALAAVLAQLEGFESPAGAWETEVIPARDHRVRAAVAG